MSFAFESMVAMRYLRSRRKEGFISVIAGFSLLGICLGVATLIIVMAVMNGFRKELLDRVLGINAHVNVSQFSRPMGNYDDLVDIIGKVEGVTSVSPLVEGQVMVSANGTAMGAVVRGMRRDDLWRKTIISTNIRGGSLENFAGGEAVILGSRMAARMGVRVGDTVTLISPKTNATFIGAIPRLKEYKVVGLFEVGMFEYDSSIIFMPFTAAQRHFRHVGTANTIEVMVDSMELADERAVAIQEALGSGYNTIDWQMAHSSFFDSLVVERNVMFLILTLIILVAAFNIISSMIMLVNDKARAIAILRTMGASSSAVMRIFMMAGSSIGVVGTLFGFLLGVGFAENIEAIRQWLEGFTDTDLFSAEIYFLSKLPAIVDFREVMIVVGMGLVLTFLATLYPAWRAARINPAEGVRYE